MGDAVACSVLVPVLNEERYLAQADPRIRVYDNPSRSVSSGLNVCLSHARGHWVARMDAHTVYPDDYIARGVARLREGGTRWVSGPQIPTGRGPVSRAVALALGGSLGRGGSRKWGVADRTEGAEYELDTGVFTGVWERATLLEYGGWDERWPRNSDSEMAARFLARGERLVCLPAMGGRYVPRDSLRGLWRQYVDYGEFRARTYRRHPHSMRASHLLAPAIVLTGATALAGPRRLRRWARLGEAIYLTSVIAAAARTRAGAERPTDAALVPVLLLAMHHGHGVGQLKGWARYGLPLRAIARLAGLSAPGTPESGPVFAPSLAARP